MHDDGIVPEKRISDLNPMNMRKLYEVNTIGPAMIAKHFIPLLDSTEKSVFAVLSARVGSIKEQLTWRMDFIQGVKSGTQYDNQDNL